MSLRVALVHSFYSSQQPSGENAQVEAEVQALLRAGVEARLFAARTDDLEDAPLYRLRTAARVATGWGASPLHDLAAFHPDVVHVHNLFPNLGRRWVAGLTAPLVVTLHNFRFACANGMLFRDGHVCTDCPDGHPWSGLRHRCYRGSVTATLPLSLALRGGPAADPVLARADRILCLSPRQRRLLERGGIPPAKIVDWSNFLPADLDPGSGAGAVPRHGAICVGRVAREKGVVDLVKAWDADSTLTIVGDGPQLAEAREAAVGRNVDPLGPVERTAAVDLLRRSTALVMPGLVPEVAPLSYVEALACGVPVVTHASSDLSARVVEDGTGEVIAAIGDAPAAAARVASNATLPARCRQVYETRYTEAIWRRRAAGLYAGLTGATR